ncbi:MAG: hypothetical protein V3T14_00845 [Myxococcota bacterium]
MTAAKIWLPAYGVWVDRSLTNEQLEQASKELVAPGTEESATLLDRLVRDQIEALPATVPLPDYVVPPPYSPSASEGVPPPSPMEPYLAVQLLDEQLGEVDPSVKLDLIDRYRAALRLGPGASAANRGRLRIGQIYLDLGFIPEARAEFRSLTEGTELEPELAARLAMSHAEASLRAPDVTRALEELEGLDLDQLPTEARRWAHRRRGDVLFSLHRFPPAVDEYHSARDLGAVDETLVMRLAISEIESGAPQEAIETLDPIRDASTRVGGLAALLRAQAHSKLGDTDGSISAAAHAGIRRASRARGTCRGPRAARGTSPRNAGPHRCAGVGRAPRESR